MSDDIAAASSSLLSPVAAFGRVVRVAAAFLVMGSSLACTHVEKRTQTIALETFPPGAAVTLTDGLGTRPVGETPKTLTEEYEIVVKSSARTGGLLLGGGALAAGGAAAIALSSELRDAEGRFAGPAAAAFYVLGVATVSGILGGFISLLQGDEDQEQPDPVPEISVALSRPGFVPVTRTLRPGPNAESKIYVKLDETPEVRAAHRESAAEAAQDRMRRVIAVMPVRLPVAMGTGDTGDELAEYLNAALLRKRAFKVVPRAQIRVAVQETKLKSYDACVDERCQIELGRAVAADLILTSSVLKVGEVCALTVALYDLKTETSEGGTSVRSSCDGGALMDAVDRALNEVR